MKSKLEHYVNIQNTNTKINNMNEKCLNKYRGDHLNNIGIICNKSENQIWHNKKTYYGFPVFVIQNNNKEWLPVLVSIWMNALPDYINNNMNCPLYINCLLDINCLL